MQTARQNLVAKIRTNYFQAGKLKKTKKTIIYFLLNIYLQKNDLKTVKHIFHDVIGCSVGVYIFLRIHNPYGFLMFSGGTERVHLEQMG